MISFVTFFAHLFNVWLLWRQMDFPTSVISVLYVFFLFFFSFLNFIFNWRIVALRYCTGFCHISTWISHRYTDVPSLLKLPPSNPLGCYRARFEFPESYSKFPLAVYFTYSSLYASMLFSPFISPSPSSPWPLSICLFSVCVSIAALWVGLSVLPF